MGVTSNWCHPQGHHARRPPTTVPYSGERFANMYVLTYWFLLKCTWTNHLCDTLGHGNSFNCQTIHQTSQLKCTITIILPKHVSSLWMQYWQQKPCPNCAQVCILGTSSVGDILSATLICGNVIPLKLDLTSWNKFYVIISSLWPSSAILLYNMGVYGGFVTCGPFY